MKTHPKTVKFYKYPNLHAEMSAVLRADEAEVAGASLACVRINRRGDLMHSSPCDECRAMLKHYGVTHIVYSSKTGIEKETI